MSIKARLFDRFRKPRGPLGILAGRIMSKRPSNQERSAWTVGLLDLRPNDRVLELGYGPGLGIQAVLERAGYTEIRHELLELDPVPAVCVLATRR